MKDQGGHTGLLDLPARTIEKETKGFLDAYEIRNVKSLAWAVRTFTLDPTDGADMRHEKRGDIVSAMWELRRQHGDRCKGYGFIVDIDERTVAVPERWDLPSKVTVGDYFVTEDRAFVAKASEPEHQATIAGILREAVKKHFKDEGSQNLGALWQDYRGFYQMPHEVGNREFCFCRKFTVTPHFLNGHLLLHVVITTITLDGRTMDVYYRYGQVTRLAEMIEKKRENRTTRRGDKVGVRVWHDERTEFREEARALELTTPDDILEHAELSVARQAGLADGVVSCTPFSKPPENVPVNRVRLILGSQITEEEHRETIIEPEDRTDLMDEVRSFVDGMDAYGKQVKLAASPLDTNHFTVRCVLPPLVRVKGLEGRETIIPGPGAFTEESLRERARRRWIHVRRYGFLRTRPINPALAWPQENGKDGLKRMVSDVNYMLENRGLQHHFSGLLYQYPEDLRANIERGGFDALLAVLPEQSAERDRPYDTHEEIKRWVEVPSQCIQIENTLPPEWVAKRHREFRVKEPGLAKRIRSNYEVAVDNLFVKHGWLPFVSGEPFHYNVHVGLDVGGRNNDTAVAAIACGLADPDQGIAFRVQKIPIDVGQAEPIPTKSLLGGLRRLFEYVRTELEGDVDFESVLFIRDGAMLGRGDEWNERDAIVRLHAEFLGKGLVSGKSLWSVAEVHKRAEYWRIYSNGVTPKNPLVGYCLMNFGRPNQALVCTTGRPYLTQGTAKPVKVCVCDIAGKAVLENVIQDFVWEADMGFTKPDMGRGLPWILHVADAGALQLSRSYSISGITA